MKPIRFFPHMILGLLLASCVTSGEPEVLTPDLKLTPMPKPTAKVGYKWYGLRDGKETTWEIIALDGETSTVRTDKGCEETRLHWGFAPNDAWRNCGAPDGTQKITAVRGELWPLAVDKTAEFDVTGSDTSGSSWSGTRGCGVTEAVRISSASGPLDTFKVVCEEPGSRYTWYMSPELKTQIYFIRYRKWQNKATVWEFIKQENASPSS